jgi:hypothetical protein
LSYTLHHELPSLLTDRGRDHELRFQARCTCGWASEPVTADATPVAWQSHWNSVPGPGSDLSFGAFGL